jgi:DNA-directed RNA polymerase subunit H (RpoH/RPB5)
MIELPSTVLRTRGLLNLRSYSVNEVYEYDDKYVMYPTRETKGDLLKYVVWILKEAKVIGVAYVKDLAREMEETNSQRGMLVGGLRFTPAAKKAAVVSKVELVDGGYASFDLFEHELVPPHIIASAEEIQLVLDHYGIERNQLPRIYRDDPAVKVLGARPGQVIRIERNSPTAGRSYYYRLVVSSG